MPTSASKTSASTPLHGSFVCHKETGIMGSTTMPSVEARSVSSQTSSSILSSNASITVIVFLTIFVMLSVGLLALVFLRRQRSVVRFEKKEERLQDVDRRRVTSSTDIEMTSDATGVYVNVARKESDVYEGIQQLDMNSEPPNAYEALTNVSSK